MRVFSLSTLREFWLIHPDAQRPLRDWYNECRGALWSSIHDVRATYPGADGVPLPDGDVATVFNIGGNKYRLIAFVRYTRRAIFIKDILTHAEYSRNRWKE